MKDETKEILKEDTHIIIRGVITSLITAGILAVIGALVAYAKDESF